MTQVSVLRASVLLASMASFGLVVVLARLFAALLGAEAVPWAQGLALFGAGFGATGAGLASRRAPPPRHLALFGVLIGAASLATIAATIALLRVAPPVDGGLAEPARLAAVAALATLPFALVGASLASALAHARAAGPRLAALALAGAAAAPPLAVALLRGVGAPRAALLLAVLLAVTGVVASIGRRGDTASAGHPAVAWGFLLGALAVLGGELGAPWLRLTYTRGARPDRAELAVWSELGLGTADVPSRGGTAKIHRDGVGSSAVVAATAEPPRQPDQMAYVLPGARTPVLIVGAGGGRDVRAALAAGQPEVYATEIDRTIVEAIRAGRLRAHAGDVYERPEVKLVVSDPRGYAARNEESFRTIVAAQPDGGTVGPASSLVRTDAGITTVEGISALLGALAPGGALVVGRPDDDAPRLVALLAAGLRARGATAPREHLFACSHQRSTAVLATRDPLDRGAVQALRAWCRRAKHREVLAPDRAGRDDLAPLADDPAAARRAVDRDLTPPTDDRPFFSHGVRPAGILRALTDPAVRAREPLLVSSLGLLVVGGLAVVALGVAGRIASGRLPPPRAAAPGGLAFFALIGAGASLAYVALLERLSLFVAHPSHALLVVLTGLLVGAAIGAQGARRVEARSIVGVASRRAQLLAIVLALLAIALDPLLASGAHLPPVGRALVALLAVVPVGILAGALAPLALRAIASGSPRRAMLALGTGGAGAAAGLGVAALLALHAGLAFVLLVAAAAHLVAAVTNPRPAHARA